MQPRRLLLHSLEERYVVGGGIALKILRVGRGERRRVFFEKLQRVRFIEARQQCRPKAVRPRSHRGGDAPFQCARVDVGFVGGTGSCDDVHTGEVRLRYLHLRFHAGRGKCLANYRFDALTDLRVVFLARHEHQAGVEPAKCVAPQQHANPRALLQAEDAGDDAVQFRNARLE